ncbi:MAG: type II toxin-antitoxin system HicB family antitoxin [Nitrospinae bacterium]|nr:type II toxin-antitoxin system HicB family antitoxin [Nitrospinota bacterium]
MNNTYRIVIHPADEGGFWADSPDLPGMVTVGATLELIRPRVMDAATLWLGAPVSPARLHLDYPVTNK